MNLANFATAANPIRASSLPKLLRCSLNAVIEMTEQQSTGVAADTGSAIHLAISTFHKHSKDVRLCIGVMQEGVKSLFPLTDLATAEQHFRRYAQDERNQKAKVILCEEKITFTLEAHKADYTQEEIVVTGTLDQVREENGILTLWDVKTGKRLEGFDMLNEHCHQLVAYQIGASKLLGKPVHGAGIIRTYDYIKRNGGAVFWHAPWEYADCDILISSVQRRVAEVRKGEAIPVPGSQCSWCPANNVANCMKGNK